LLFFFSDFSSPYARHQKQTFPSVIALNASRHHDARTDSFFRFFVSVVDVALRDFSFFSFFSFFSEDFSLVFPMLSSPLRRYRRLFVAIEYKRNRLRAVRRLTRTSVPSSVVRPSACVVERMRVRSTGGGGGWLVGLTCLCVFCFTRKRSKLWLGSA
jgi:hypothetical protein